MADSVEQRQAEAFFKDKKYSEALDLYRVLHRKTNEAKYMYNCAICLYYLNRISDAVPILEGLASSRQIFPDSAVFVGFCYRALNQTGRARVHFSELVKQTVGEWRIKCRVMVAMLLDEGGQIEEAERDYASLLADPDLLGKNRAEVCRRMATILENKKDHPGALALYRESLTHDAEGEPALAAKFRMAVCMMELASQIEALDLLKEVEEGAKGTFLGESAEKLRTSIEAGVRRTERNIRSYE